MVHRDVGEPDRSDAPARAFTEFPVLTLDGFLVSITAGPEGNLWFTENSGDQIGRITTDGVITEFAIPTGSSYPTEITSGPDGNLWFTEGQGRPHRADHPRWRHP